ncbi:hypothetical protein AALP_AA1G225400 [Arabis alpina]|uniref:Uncharacterized protein n=1 Tax=Arabis alpina TaxID=50452 RepID=A0A087HPY1_ARAAL|nr:hypothetical protein AALP_AA1G225400 [Arabis alpina]
MNKASNGTTVQQRYDDPNRSVTNECAYSFRAMRFMNV